jgi:hypothetical protein
MWCVVIDEQVDEYVVGPFPTKEEAEAYAEERNTSLECQADVHELVKPTEPGKICT